MQKLLLTNRRSVRKQYVLSSDLTNFCANTEQTHPLLQKPTVSTRYADDAEGIGLVRGRNKQRVFDETDEDLAPLLSQFRSHLESIQANGNQLEGVGDAIAVAQASLRIALSAT
jgi:CENP-Q, a CENPA-CAD centromere complex subunit